MTESEENGSDLDYLSVLNFEPSKVQFKINDLKEWKASDSDNDLQIGTFIKIKDGNERSIIAQIQSYQTVENTENNIEPDERKLTIVVTAKPLGVLQQNGEKQIFTSGIKNISIPPKGVELTTDEDLITMLSKEDSDDAFSFGHYILNQKIKINLDGNRFFSHHIGIVGSTGSGKSGTVTKILQNVIRHRKDNIDKSSKEVSALNNSHIVIFDIHGEYGHAFPGARTLTVNAAGSDEMEVWIPYWLLNSEELESLFIETGENNAYNQIAQFKVAVIKNKEKWNPNVKNIDYDMPIYFSIREVFEYIKNKNFESHYTASATAKTYYAVQDEDPVEYLPDNYNYLFKPHNFYPTTGNTKNPKLKEKVDAKKNGFYGEFTRFITRFQARLNDVRFNFLLQEPDDPQKFHDDPFYTFISLVPVLFGDKVAEKEYINESNLTIIDLSAMPFEVVSSIVSVVSRLAFELSFYQTRIWGQNKTPLLMVYEEAHRYVPKIQSAKYRDTRDAVERIAKEGRKYGISEMVVTQRPSEISPTVLSQCNNFVIMKLTNQDDQNIVHSILPDTDSYFSTSLSSLNRQEALLVGDAMMNTSVVRVDNANPLPQSLDVDVYSQWSKNWEGMVFDKVVSKMMNIDLKASPDGNK